MSERELVEPMGEARALHDDTELVGNSEVRQPHATRRVLLREVDLAFGAVRRSPLPHATLQGAKHALVVVTWMAALQLFEQRDGVELAVDSQQGNNLGVPDLGQRIVSGAPATSRPL